MQIFGKTDKGIVRNMNQDSLFYTDKKIGKLPNLVLVADGMGGEKAGDYASSKTVQIITDTIKKDDKNDDFIDILMESINKANEYIYKESIDNRNLRGMGTTLVAAVVSKNMLFCINVGDSRLYIIRNGKIKQITKDHSLVEEMVEQGKITRDSNEYKKQKNIITRAVGIEHWIIPDEFSIELQDEDKILICTDGLTNMVEDKEICEIISHEDIAQDASDKLISSAISHGGMDNITAVLIYPYESEVDV